MNTARIPGLIDQLRTARGLVAARSAGLTEMDITRAALKSEIVGEMTSKGIAVTPAEKAASQDTRMVAQAHDRVVAELRRDETLADAEALQFTVQLALVEAEAAAHDPQGQFAADDLVSARREAEQLRDDYEMMEVRGARPVFSWERDAAPTTATRAPIPGFYDSPVTA